MEVPRYWRNRDAYLGTPDGGLEGSRCPICGESFFPSRAGTVCPNCHWYSSQAVEIQKNLGVGALLFAEVNGVLNLVLFKDICNAINDQDEHKKERIARSNYTLSNTDSFTIPKGLNTVTGKIEVNTASGNGMLNENSSINAQADAQGDVRIDGQGDTQIDGQVDAQVDAQLINLLTQSMQREIEEEAGVNLSAESLHLLTRSQVEIDQFRGYHNEKDQPIIHHFVIYAFAALLSQDELAILQKSHERSIELFDVSNLDELQKREVRKATQAILTFLSTALLFLGQSEIKEIKEKAISEESAVRQPVSLESKIN